MIVIQDLCDDFPMRNGAWRLLPACLAFFSLGFVSSNGQKEREIKKKNSEIIHSVGMYFFRRNIQKKNASDKNNKFPFGFFYTGGIFK